MKDFTYSSKKSLRSDAFHWLSNMGLKETQWILDTKWLSIVYNISYKEWINE